MKNINKKEQKNRDILMNSIYQLNVSFFKKDLKCEYCDKKEALTFHHLNPKTKNFDISNIPLGTSIVEIENEVKK